MKRIISLILTLILTLSIVTIPVYSAEELVDVVSVHNADFEIKSSATMLRAGKNVFDKDIVSMAGVTDYNGVKIFDINGNAGGDYAILMTITADKVLPMEKIKMYWQQYDGPIAYLGKPTEAYPVGFSIYASSTGEANSWQRIYYDATLEGDIKKEQVSRELWDDTDGWRSYYEFDLGSVYNAKYIRFAIEGMQPFLGGIEIPEINIFADKTNINTSYKTVSVTASKGVEYEISGTDMIGENYCKAGSTVYLKVNAPSYFDVKSVKLGSTTLTATDGVYTFSMPSEDAKITVRTSLNSTESLPLRMISYSVAGGETVYSNTVPVITMVFNNPVGEISKTMALVNGTENTGLIQHVFVDAVDRKKVHIVPFADKLEAGKTYKVTLDSTLESAAGMWLAGTPTATFKTDASYEWNYDSLNERYINGYGDGTFRPDEYLNLSDAIVIGKRLRREGDFSKIVPEHTPITRAQFARVLYIARKGFCLDSDKEMFDMLVREGVFRGTEEGTYDPDGYVTRAEAVVLLNRAIGRNSDNVEYNPENIFSDVPENHWARNDITIAASDKYSTALPWIEDIPAIKNLDVYNKDKDEWKTLPVVTQEVRDMGETGGEGGQWMQAIECDNVDGQLLFAGVDIAGLLRSTDGGNTWHRSFAGMFAGGCVDIDIDPNNKNRVLAIGSLTNTPITGIYLSEDMGDNWTQVFSYSFNGQRDTRDQLAWDKSSYDSSIGGSKIAYWSNEWRICNSHVPKDQNDVSTRSDKQHGLIKTTDGGKTWFVVNEAMSDCVVRVHPTKGYVYAGNENGFFRSEDGGKTFTQIVSGMAIYGLDVVENYPDNVYINDQNGVMISTDGGRTFTRPANKDFPFSYQSDVRNIVRDLSVSPANPQNMMVDKRDFIYYTASRYYTNDGGATWHESAYDGSKDFFFNHPRQHPYTWHPTNENKVWSLGGDWITSSEDAGKTFIWDSNGVSGTPPGGRLNFNPFDTDLLYCSAQDVTGMFSTNGGYTFTHPQIPDIWGNCYGGYAVDENLVFTTISEGWYDPRMLYVSHDGGQSFEDQNLQLKFAHARRGTTFWGSLKDRDTYFAGEYVSRDRCETWTRLPGCDIILTMNYHHNREIYGIRNNSPEYSNKNDVIMVSYDDGRTWLPFLETKIDNERLNNERDVVGNYDVEVWDLDYDGVNDVLYYVNGYWASCNNFVRVTDNVQENLGVRLNADEKMGTKMYSLVSVDPRHPEIVYVGGGNPGQKSGAAIQRSCDGGETWQIISKMGDSKSVVKTGMSGGSGQESIIVHPETGEVLIWTIAEGLMTFPAPYDE